ncbi:unnamed protein product [Didymodactylos carnosus]|uniref:Uncharacterized protein n=1 Tax=Didymodactylos carnosus TaxID=1234261 RepID=A0A813S0D1_9BILA|nr:unnamed protein product [Didymodactylos carnosus]CAF0914582.1 unnamed protein product [Didymodactylos carnosus]CAF3572871.1 unnamed protein product [Didymodactylos carnosus]CAF3693125.1 unnamed protein product [Didymodactylos carnosus]
MFSFFLVSTEIPTSTSSAYPSDDFSSTIQTKDFIGLTIGIILVLFVILMVVICKWSQCSCLKKRNNAHHSILPPASTTTTTSTPLHHQESDMLRRSFNTAHNQNYSSPRFRLDNIVPPQVPLKTATLHIQPHVVPRISISPQVSGSSLTNQQYTPYK